MEPETIKSWVDTASASIAALHQAIGFLPSGTSKAEAQRLLEGAEFEFKRAQADTASQLGFELCARCWPPEILLLRDDNKLTCRGCGKPPPPEDAKCIFF